MLYISIMYTEMIIVIMFTNDGQNVPLTNNHYLLVPKYMQFFKSYTFYKI